MTPGFAKSRQELFWLPYPEPDKVIINAHNLTPAWTSTVNGKTPLGAWVPSRDTAGNGTTTLTDLVSTNNGTLTNMDAATDWVANTGSGGVRALDFDGSNDYVNFGTITNQQAGTSTDFTISVWINARSTGAERGIFMRINSSDVGYGITISSGFVRFPRYDAGPRYAVSTNTWYHCVGLNRSGVRELWVNGTRRDSGVTTGGITSSVINTVIGRYYSNFAGFNFDGLIDDARFFGTALDSTDIAALYASGSGRGVQA